MPRDRWRGRRGFSLSAAARGRSGHDSTRHSAQGGRHDLSSHRRPADELDALTVMPLHMLTRCHRQTPGARVDKPGNINPKRSAHVDSFRHALMCPWDKSRARSARPGRPRFASRAGRAARSDAPHHSHRGRRSLPTDAGGTDRGRRDITARRAFPGLIAHDQTRHHRSPASRFTDDAAAAAAPGAARATPDADEDGGSGRTG